MKPIWGYPAQLLKGAPAMLDLAQGLIQPKENISKNKITK